MDKETLLKDLPPFEGQRVTVTARQDVATIMQEILEAHQDYASHYDRIAKHFSDIQLDAIPEKLWDFCKDNLTYEIEQDRLQTVRSPAAILVLDEMRGVDCKHLANFIGGTLDAVNRAKGKYFEWCYRFASYDFGHSTPEHVFIVIKKGNREIWVDPVLEKFNTRLPYPIWIEDHKPNAMLERISGTGKSLGYSAQGFNDTNYTTGVLGCGCNGSRIGLTGQAAGTYISAVAPYLAYIPVVGWVAAAAGEVAGVILRIWGSKYPGADTSGVRWLTQLYEYYTLGLPTQSDNQVNVNNIKNSQAWFSYVLGVPMYDRYRFNSLQNSAQEYLQYPDTQNVDPQIAQQASLIAQTMLYSAPIGGWKGYTVAPWLVQETLTPSGQPTGQLAPGQSLAPAAGGNLVQWAQANPIPALAIAGGAAFLLTRLIK